MISSIKRFLRRYSSNRAQVVVLIPSRRFSPNDPVAAIAEFLPEFCRRSSECIFLEKNTAHFTDVMPLLKMKSKKHLVLFAHPTESYVGFEVNGASLSASSDHLAPDWWARPHQNWEMLVAHVCEGRKILEHSSWYEVFPTWVSYNIAIDTFLVDDRDKKLWAEIGNAIVQATIESRSAEHLANRIVAAYLLKIAELGDFGHPSDVVHILHFEMAHRGMVFKQDGVIFDRKDKGWA